LGLFLGILAALKHNSFWDSLCTVISVIGVSVPSYVFALGLCYFVAFLLGWFPTLYTEASPFVSTVLPTISLSMFTIATIARFTRTEMLDVLGSDYMLLAESKGVYGARLVWRHAIRNALIPVITVLGPLVVDLMTGSMVVEKIFSIPGVGTLLVQAIQTNDYNVTVVLAFVYSLMYVLMMLVVDVLYGVIDPRIRLTKEDG
jgi:oligopeptide transport system permease protein